MPTEEAEEGTEETQALISPPRARHSSRTTLGKRGKMNHLPAASTSPEYTPGRAGALPSSPEIRHSPRSTLGRLRQRSNSAPPTSTPTFSPAHPVDEPTSSPQPILSSGPPGLSVPTEVVNETSNNTSSQPHPTGKRQDLECSSPPGGEFTISTDLAPTHATSEASIPKPPARRFAFTQPPPGAIPFGTRTKGQETQEVMTPVAPPSCEYLGDIRDPFGIEGTHIEEDVESSDFPNSRGPRGSAEAEVDGGVPSDLPPLEEQWPAPRDDLPATRLRRRVMGETGTGDPPQVQTGGEVPVMAPAADSGLVSTGVHTRGTPTAALSQDILDRDWSKEYFACPTWGPIYTIVTGSSVEEWPRGIRILRGKMYDNGLLCVPMDLIGPVVRAHHGDAGHPGASRLWHQFGRWYHFADPKTAEHITQGIQRACEVCQACDPARAPYRCYLEATPVPPYLMDSVAVDLFMMPEVKHEGHVYDCMVLCVDRQSGWMVATPHRYKGLTAEKVAKTMYRQWEIFGVPSVVTSDRGQHWAAAWWETLCAAMGVRRAFGQAYHHQANGRAEVAGQRVMNVLKKLITDVAEREASWVVLLPKALRHLHDAPGEAGISPYEIVFGRQRALQGLPHSPPREAEGASQFMQRMRAQDERIAAKLNALHNTRWSRINAKRMEPPPFAIGDLVWYRPEPQPGRDKLAPQWRRGVVKGRVGHDSYVVEISAGVNQEAHRSQLKPHTADTLSENPLSLFYFSGKAAPLEVGPDEWLVEEIRAHRRNTSSGELEFLVRWKDWDATDLQWQPWKSFIQFYNDDLVQYCVDKGISLDLVRLARPSTTQGASTLPV
jgi:hypothetical protein